MGGGAGSAAAVDHSDPMSQAPADSPATVPQRRANLRHRCEGATEPDDSVIASPPSAVTDCRRIVTVRLLHRNVTRVRIACADIHPTVTTVWPCIVTHRCCADRRFGWLVRSSTSVRVAVALSDQRLLDHDSRSLPSTGPFRACGGHRCWRPRIAAEVDRSGAGRILVHRTGRPAPRLEQGELCPPAVNAAAAGPH